WVEVVDATTMYLSAANAGLNSNAVNSMTPIICHFIRQDCFMHDFITFLLAVEQKQALSSANALRDRLAPPSFAAGEKKCWRWCARTGGHPPGTAHHWPGVWPGRCRG